MNKQMFFRHEVHDIGQRTGWPEGRQYEARMNEFTLVASMADDERSFNACLSHNRTPLVQANGETLRHAVELLESKVRMLRTGLESLTAP